MSEKLVLFVCVHNSGRSQMAEALFNSRATELGVPVHALSAGTMGGKQLNPAAVEAVSELGISMKGQAPKLLTPGMVANADKIISMGCGVDAEACPTKFILTEDWELEDPAGKDLEFVRVVRDQIAQRVDELLRTYAEVEAN